LFLVQTGQHPPAAKPLKGLGSGVVELVEDFDGDTYRAVYTVRFSSVVYVLHAFMKKSKRGIKTPKTDVDLIKQRLRDAEDDYRQRSRRGATHDKESSGRSWKRQYFCRSRLARCRDSLAQGADRLGDLPFDETTQANASTGGEAVGDQLARGFPPGWRQFFGILRG